ncbi:hypothetical protein [Streptomyces longisporoflavus]|uniref:Ribosomal protein L7/L12 C-terminal domain-containing protein n=1 Tax=Streptomyces longisporoflavus TaxID=28044 RepID=A0ABW7QP66_9ACTN
MNTVMLVVIALTGIVAIVTVEGRSSRLDRRVRALDRKMDLLLEHLQVRDDDPQLAQVTALAREGQDIAAIKKYREITGAGLLEAKQAVDRMTP